MYRNKLAVKALVVCALAVAALVSQPASTLAAPTSTCYVCGNATLCPADISNLGEFEWRCQAQCGLYTYIGACTDDGPCGYVQTLWCYEVERR